jgi:hypothetical protein
MSTIANTVYTSALAKTQQPLNDGKTTSTLQAEGAKG